MKVYTCNNYYLAHHGIEGQKWGVRRFQEEDGSLTNAGLKRYYGPDAQHRVEEDKSLSNRDRKKILKNIKYRDKMAAKAEKRSNQYKNLQKQAEDEVKDLEKNGILSETYRERIADRNMQRDREHFVDSFGEERSTGSKILSSLMDLATSSWDIKNVINETKEEAAGYKKSAKEWTERNKAIMNMPISADMSRRDIRKAVS